MFLYHFLEKIGYTHPLHPMLTHMPSGLVIAAFLFAMTALFLKRPALARTARHCILLAFIFLFPTILLGYTDWQYYYAGAWLFSIKIKVVFAIVLFILLLLGILLGRKGEEMYKKILGVYALSLLCVIIQGYFGSDLVHARKTLSAPEKFQTGARIYREYCAECHPQGGNVINPNLPLIGSRKMVDFNTFLEFNHDPKRPDGSTGSMPPFPPSKISDQDEKELYEYIINVLQKNPQK